jgi:hypothetical protein
VSTLRSHKPTPALIISIVALIVALGGTGYAALNVPTGSVGTAQLRDGAVSTKKLQNGAVTAAKINPRKLTAANALRANRANTARTATTALTAISATTANGVGTLASGQTEQGTWFLSDWAETGTDGSAVSAITFPIPLAQPPTAVHYIELGQPTPSGCTGDTLNPGAAPGNLCVFEGRAFNAGGIRGVEDPTDSELNASERFGTGVYMIGTNGSGEADTGGSWAVTAP